MGNSQGLRRSRQLLELAGIAVGDEVEITVSDHQITARTGGALSASWIALPARS